MTPNGLLYLLDQAEQGKLWAAEFLDRKTTHEDYETFDMETISRFSQVIELSMIDFFDPADLLESGYLSEDEFIGVQMAGMEEI